MLLQRIHRTLKPLTRNQRGMTLIEIMIVLAIMAAVMGGVMVSVRSGMERTRISDTKTRAGNIAAMVDMERIANPRAQPSIDSLGLAESQLVDGWGNRFVIQYSGNEFKIISGGPDGSVGGADDISFPE